MVESPGRAEIKADATDQLTAPFPTLSKRVPKMRFGPLMFHLDFAAILLTELSRNLTVYCLVSDKLNASNYLNQTEFVYIEKYLYLEYLFIE